MAETIGSLCDKISIVELRRHHTEEAMLNPEAPVELRHECAQRLRIIDEQRADLSRELTELWSRVIHEGWVPKVYRQLKMYNDARLRSASSRAVAVARPETVEPDPPNVIELANRRPDRPG